MKSIEKVKIRMYRQGLGDCFLLTFYNEKEEKFNLLLDCGVLSTSDEFKTQMIKVANNIKKVTDNKIDVLVVTHEHWDHLSGFLQAQTVFDKMKIEKIWMAWTENPKDSYAKKLKESQNNKLNAITIAYDRLKNQSNNNFNAKQEEGHREYLNAFNSFFNFYGIDNSGTNLKLNNTGDAFDTLKNRTNSHKEYLSPASNDVIELNELPGVRIYVLGPPKDDKALNKMNPSKKNSEVYELIYNNSLGVSFNSAFDTGPDKNNPFNSKECINEKEAKEFYKSYYKSSENWRKIDDDWLYSAGNLAIALDKAVNNTCLVLAFEFIDSGKVLLFPADAQIGNWLSWSNYQWLVKNGEGNKETISIDDLLKRTVFYKVGHHGSHNATMKDQGLEKMNSKELIAMIPVDQKMAKARRWKMPFKPLLDALNEKAKNRVIIMDEEFPGSISSINQFNEGNTELYFDVIINNK